MADLTGQESDTLAARQDRGADADRVGQATAHGAAAWNATAADYPREATVPSLFAAQVRRTPEAVALACGETSLSYAALDAESDRIAAALRRLGVAAGQRIGVFLDRSPALVAGLLGVLKTGAAYVPLDPNYPPARLAHVVEDAALAAIVTRGALAGGLAAIGVTLLDVDDPAVASGPADIATVGARPGDVAYVIYTSGSTGKPKGVQIQHRALVNLLWSMRRQPGLTASDVLVGVTTVAFDIAGLEIFLPLIVGARLVLATDAQTVDGGALLALLRRWRATVMQATPVTWRMLIEAGWTGDPALTMLCGGEALQRQLADALLQRGPALWNMYGPTETTIWSSVLLVMPGTEAVPIGPPIANTQFHVLDEQRAPVPAGTPGELYIGGDGLALGYLGLPAMNAERFVPDPFGTDPFGAGPFSTGPFSAGQGARLYRTGDIVRQHPSGTLDFLGRADQQIKLRGFRIELGEIEAAILSHPDISEAVAVAATDPSGEPAIHAYAVRRADARMPDAALLGALRALLGHALPGYMQPAAIVLPAALPRTPNGKIDRQALPAPAQPAAPALPAARRRRLTETERGIAAIWSSVLGRGPIDPGMNFFEQGGHSLLAARVLGRVSTAFGCRLPLAALFEAPTLEAFAHVVDTVDLRAFDFRQVVRLQPAGRRAPLIAINNTGVFFPLARHLGDDHPFTALQLFDPSHPPDRLLPYEEIAAGYVALIRTVQPAGPYALIGWCNAGILAFEIGRQLHALDGQAPLVVMVDTWAPGYWARLPRWQAALGAASHGLQMTGSGVAASLAKYRSWPLRLRKLGADLGALLTGRQKLDHFLPRHQVVKRAIRLVYRPAAPRPLASDAVSIDYGAAEDYEDWLTRYLDRGALTYVPRRYKAHLLLLRAGREPESRLLDRAMGWTGLAEGGLDVFTVPGDHFSMFQGAGVEQMAAHVAAALAGHGEATTRRTAGGLDA